ncbi:hypothetical protein HQ520_12405, partial [bacterium]|nr:hypothetical protein [bacterium]
TYSYTTAEGDTWASEMWYTTLLGEDPLPDVILGRIPARLNEDAEEMVRKVIAFKTPPKGPWRGRFAYCADDSGDFSDATDRLFNDYRSPAIAGKRVYLENFPFEDNFYLPKSLVRDRNLKVSTATTLELLNTYNRGVSAMFFMGHGSPNIWTDERIWFGGDSENSDNLNLENELRLPFIATFTCNQGAFDYPKPKWHICISEDMMRVKSGGAAALYVPSGPGYTTDHEAVAQPLLQALLRERVARLGDAVHLSQLYCLLQGKTQEALRMYVFLGDPTIQIPLPAEEISGTVTPGVLAARDGKKQNLRFEASPSDANRGRMLAFLFNPDQEEVLHGKAMPFENGRLTWKFPLPDPAPAGEWTVRVYYASETDQADGLAYGTFRVENPTVRISSLSWLKKPEETGQTAKIQVTVENPTDVPIQNVEITARIAQAQRKGTSISRKNLNLQPGEKKNVRFSRKITAPLTQVKALVTGAENHEMVLFLPGDSATTAILFLNDLVRVEAHSYDPTANLTIIAPVYHAGLEAPIACRAHIIDDSGTPAATADFLLNGNAASRGQDEIRLHLQKPRRDLPQSWRLLVTRKPPLNKAVPQTALTSTGLLLDASLTLPLPDLPDLKPVPDSARFTPAVPKEGETVFMDLDVENVGSTPSAAFQIRAMSVQSGQPDKVLRSQPQISAWNQSPLAVGERRNVRLRWDYDAYTEYGGEKTIRIELDANKAVPELDESNNILETPLRILTRESVHLTSTSLIRQTETDAEVEVTAILYNSGEAPALNRNLGFYRRQPIEAEDYLDPEFLVHEMELAPLPGLTTQTFTYSWPTERDQITTPSTQIYRTLKTIRALGPNGTHIEPEW